MIPRAMCNVGKALRRMRNIEDLKTDSEAKVHQGTEI
jgi:hypothetical protein